MKGYKGFDKNFKCKDMQYEVGKEFSVDGELELCWNGLHFCKYPLDVFTYYGPSTSKFAEVESLGEVKNEGSDHHPGDAIDSKVCTNKLKVCTEIGIPDLVYAAVDYIKDNFDLSKAQKTIAGAKDSNDFSVTANIKDLSIASNTNFQSAAVNTGDRSLARNESVYSAATNTGDFSVATNIGRRSAATNTGDQSAATNTGEESAALNVGYDGVAINMGEHSVATTSGRNSVAINKGNQSLATSTGTGSIAVVTGESSIAVAFGCRATAKGSLGSWIVLSEWVCSHKIGVGKEERHCVVKDVQCFKVDGKDILPDTFYRLVNGKPVVAEEE